MENLEMEHTINSEVSKTEKYFVLSIILTLFVIFAYTSSFGTIEYIPIPGFISICGISIFIVSLQTAFLLYNQSKIRFDSAIALLSSGYFLISFLVLGRIIFLPGALLTPEYINEESQISAWLWTIWHLVFPIYIILYSLIDSKFSISYSLSQLTFKAVPLISLGIILFLTFYDNNLPKLVNENSYTATIHYDISLLFLCFVSMLFLISQRGINHRQDLWLLLALSVHGLDILYGITGGARYSAGWYLALINSVLASTIILGVFIHHLIQIAQSMSLENDYLKNISEQDELTKISNRRKFNFIFETLWSLSLHQRKPLCLIIIDIDNFKSYNDKFGHPQGDECLIRIANILQQVSKRETDLVARIGGEEFAILLYGIHEKEGAIFAERARKMVEDEQIPSANSHPPYVTISVGYGVVTPHSRFNYKGFINKVDGALYTSKHKGKNTISCIESREPSKIIA